MDRPLLKKVPQLDRENIHSWPLHGKARGRRNERVRERKREKATKTEREGEESE